MQKIPTLFQRNFETDRLVRDAVTPGLEYVLEGNCLPTVKYDGSCCLVRDERLYKRYELKPGKQAPEGFEPAQEPDPETGKTPGWIAVGTGPEDQYHREAWEHILLIHRCPPDNGTYELVGPRVQGNAEHFLHHRLLSHGRRILYPLVNAKLPLTFAKLQKTLDLLYIEGIVWWQQGIPVAKLKRRDFGFSWPVKPAPAGVLVA